MDGEAKVYEASMVVQDLDEDVVSELKVSLSSSVSLCPSDSPFYFVLFFHFFFFFFFGHFQPCFYLLCVLDTRGRE